MGYQRATNAGADPILAVKSRHYMRSQGAAMSPRQARFVAEYAVDGNAAAAARRAGYSPVSARANGPRLLKNAAIREALAVSQRPVH